MGRGAEVATSDKVGSCDADAPRCNYPAQLIVADCPCRRFDTVRFDTAKINQSTLHVQDLSILAKHARPG